jgi:hypothetical protein
MKILAITTAGKEFIYNYATARAVSDRSAEKIAEIVNAHKYLISGEKKWHCYDIDRYDRAYEYALVHKFKIRKGIVSDCVYGY